MPTIHVKNGPEFDVEEGTRLLRMLRDHEVDILHRCGGYAGCTTCRVVFHEGEPERMTEAELKKLREQGRLGDFRLSCQVECTHDMMVEPLMSIESTGLDDRGPEPKPHITPSPPEWTEKPAEV